MANVVQPMTFIDVLDEYYVRAAPPEHVGDSARADDFQRAFRHYPAGVAVVTANATDGPVGLTATSVISLSAEPPILAFSLSALASATPGILSSDTVVVHLIGASQLTLAQTFATSGIDRYAGLGWSPLPTGEPLIHGVNTWLRGRATNRMATGSSIVVAVRVLETCAAATDYGAPAPLVYHNRTWHGLGEHSRIE